jgi:glycosyltransferase involved in cell wall biosynthesis
MARGRDPAPVLIVARIAYLSPMPPAPTGVATYSAAVVRDLRAIGFGRRHRLDIPSPREAHSTAVRRSDLALYHIGNNVSFHGEIYGLAIRHPGLVVLHDLALDDLARGLLDTGDPFGTRTREEALAAEERPDGPVAEGPLRTPWCALVARRARGVIVHAPYAKRYLEAFGCRTPVHVVPHPAMPGPTWRSRRGARRLRSRHPGRVLIGVLGDIGRAKGIDAVLDAALGLGPQVHVAVVGRRIPGYDVEAEVIARGMADRVTVAADVTDGEFMAWLLACDLVVNLRHPHRGEVSGTLIRAMQEGIPAVVSPVGTYLDWPEGTVVPTAPGPPRGDGLAATLEPLVVDPSRRREVGEEARRHLARLRREQATARGYEAAVDQTLSLLGDPGEAAVGRWAGVLADIGASPEAVRRGLGAEYLDALEEIVAGPMT